MDFTKPIYGQKKLILCGHRGDRTGADENTMAAFRRALDAGCDMAETDLHRTKDGKIVLRHDSFIEGIGEIKDHTYGELLKAKPDLPLLKDLAELAREYPGLGLLIELKDVPPSGPGGNGTPVTHPAPYSGSVPECSGMVYGPEPGKVPMEEKGPDSPDKGVSYAEEEEFAYNCADEAARILLEYGLGNRVWILSFSGKLLEYVYKRYGRQFRYHAFYPWFIMGDMESDPAQFCELACMQHRFLSKEGRVIRYQDPMCPESWWKDVLDMGLVPVGAPSLNSDDNYMEAMRRGCGMINANDPVHIRDLVQHDSES